MVEKVGPNELRLPRNSFSGDFRFSSLLGRLDGDKGATVALGLLLCSAFDVAIRVLLSLLERVVVLVVADV